MKSIQFIIAIILLPFFGYTQVINQDADGFSTIVMPSANLNLDIINSVVSFNYYTYVKDNGVLPDVTRSRTILGGEVKGKGVNGISTLFSNEEIVADASIKLFIGFENHHDIIKDASLVLSKLGVKKKVLDKQREANWDAYSKFLEDLHSTPGKIEENKFNELYKLRDNSNPEDWKRAKQSLVTEGSEENKAIKMRIDKLQELFIEYQAIIDSLQKSTNYDKHLDQLEIQLSRTVIKGLYGEEIYGSIKANLMTKNDISRWITGRETILKELGKLHFNYEKPVGLDVQTGLLGFFSDEFIGILTERKEIMKEIERIDNKEWEYYFTTWYIKGGFSGVGFKYDTDNNAPLIRDRFVNKSFNGYDIELGYNIQYKSYNYYGIGVRATYANNLSGLRETEYSFSKADTTITGGAFSTTSKLHAFAGDFDTFMKYSVNFDYVRVLPIDKYSNLFITINPYLRHNIYSRSRTLRNNTIAGFGINAFNSEKQKIMGGLFIQTNDLLGVHAGEDSTLGKRIAIGLVAKFAFTGIDLK